MPRIAIDRERCKNDGLCVELCGSGVFARDNEVVTIVHEERCSECGRCLAICPGDAIIHAALDPALYPKITDDMMVEPERLAGFLRSRRSHRRFQERPVPREVLERLVDIGRFAPSGDNLQSPEYLVLTDPPEIWQAAGTVVAYFRKIVKLLRNPLVRLAYRFLEGPEAIKNAVGLITDLERLVREYDAGQDPIFYAAPAVLILHAHRGIETAKDDCCYAAYNMVLMAHSMGLGTCFIGYLSAAARRDKTIAKKLGIPPSNGIYTAFILGYPKVKFRRLMARRPPRVTWR